MAAIYSPPKRKAKQWEGLAKGMLEEAAALKPLGLMHMVRGMST
jgi:hypothetical protein